MGTQAQDSAVFRGQLLAHFGEIPQCDFCKHIHADNDFTCDAYPDDIPGKIMTNVHDHTKPFPGDHGIGYEARAA